VEARKKEMAIYHCSVKIGGRSKGQSAVAASAYRSGERLIDKETGTVCDYTRKVGIIHREVSLCKNAPIEYAEREKLWNAVHAVEKSKAAQLWREIEVALPKEWSQGEQIDAVREYVRSLTEKGMCADWSVHDKGDGNPHAHIMLTTRPIKSNGQWEDKERKAYALDENGERIPIISEETGLQKLDSRKRKQWKRVYVQANEWNAKERVEEWREAWAMVCNKRLSSEKQLDHRSYARQEKEQYPTIHEGYVARKLEASGQQSERCEINRKIEEQKRLSQAIEVTEVELKGLIAEKGEINERIEALIKRRSATRPAGGIAVGERKLDDAAECLPGEVTKQSGGETAAAIAVFDATLERARTEVEADDSAIRAREANEASKHRERERARNAEAERRKRERAERSREIEGSSR